MGKTTQLNSLTSLLMKNTKKFGLAFLMLLLPALLFAQSIADEIISTQKQLAKIDSQRQILLANLEDFKLQKIRLDLVKIV